MADLQESALGDAVTDGGQPEDSASSAAVNRGQAQRLRFVGAGGELVGEPVKTRAELPGEVRDGEAVGARHPAAGGDPCPRRPQHRRLAHGRPHVPRGRGLGAVVARRAAAAGRPVVMEGGGAAFRPTEPANHVLCSFVTTGLPAGTAVNRCRRTRPATTTTSDTPKNAGGCGERSTCILTCGNAGSIDPFPLIQKIFRRRLWLDLANPQLRRGTIRTAVPAIYKSESD